MMQSEIPGFAFVFITWEGHGSCKMAHKGADTVVEIVRQNPYVSDVRDHYHADAQKIPTHGWQFPKKMEWKK